MAKCVLAVLSFFLSLSLLFSLSICLMEMGHINWHCAQRSGCTSHLLRSFARLLLCRLSTQRRPVCVLVLFACHGSSQAAALNLSLLTETRLSEGAGWGLNVCPPRGGSAVLGLHHRDYCNTAQMGPCCNRLGRHDWTTAGRHRSGDGCHGSAIQRQKTTFSKNVLFSIFFFKYFYYTYFFKKG